MNDRIPALAAKILLAFVSLTLFIIVVEGFFRLVPVHRDQFAMPIDDVLMPDDELIWRLKPYTSGPFTTNELGLRDTPYNRKAAVKILLLGDSVAWGDGIHDPKLTFPWRLEQQLGVARGKPVEVINSAVPGYSTFQELRYLERYGLDLKPDLVVVQFCLNDVIERFSRLAQYGGDNYFIGIDTRHAVRGVHGWLLRNSRAYETGMRFAVRLARNQQEYQVEKLTNDPLSKELTDAWDLTLSELDQIRELAATNRIPLVILVMPYRFQLDNPHQTDQPQKRLKEWAEAKGVSLVDPLPRFAEFQKQNGKTPLFFDPSHLTIEGHTLTADLLASAIEKPLKD